MLQKGFVTVPLMVFVTCLVVVGGVFYFIGRDSNETKVETFPQPSASVVTTVIDRMKASPSAFPHVIWNKSSFERFSFEYPAGWLVEAKVDSYIEGPHITITDPGKKVAIGITSPNGLPFGFGGPDNKMTNSVLKVRINGVDYDATQTIVNDKSAFVHMKIGTPKPVSILMGTDYPTDGKGTLADYNQHRDTLLKILETLTF